MEKNKELHYMPISPQDEEWGIVCTTAGYQVIPRGHEYPPEGIHPNDYYFNKLKGRVLREYQMVYIVDGEGWFESTHCKRTQVKAGTILMLFPGEWHNYSPNKATGWKEYWIGFRGRYIDERVEKGFFSPNKPIVVTGNDINIETFYIEVLREAQYEKKGFQLLISGIVLHILGIAVYRQNATPYESSVISDKIDQAKNLMKMYIGQNISPEQIAKELGMGYTWFRSMFKECTGISPAQYQQQLRYLQAKSLLLGSDLNISDIAYKLGFSNVQHFSTFFSKYEGASPKQFRKVYIGKN